jgi:hypothetical protein
MKNLTRNKDIGIMITIPISMANLKVVCPMALDQIKKPWILTNAGHFPWRKMTPKRIGSPAACFDITVGHFAFQP